MTALLHLTGLRSGFTQSYQRLTQQLQWLIELARLLEARDALDQPRTARQVKAEVSAFLERLGGIASEQPEHAHVIAQMRKAVRNRWWGLFTCYRIPHVPSSNNGLETFFNNLKHHQRRITGRKSVQEFILRYGPFAAFIDYSESLDDLLTRLRPVPAADFQKARQTLQQIEVRLQKLHHYRHQPDEYFRKLESRWEQAVSAN